MIFLPRAVLSTLAQRRICPKIVNLARPDDTVKPGEHRARAAPRGDSGVGALTPRPGKHWRHGLLAGPWSTLRLPLRHSWPRGRTSPLSSGLCPPEPEDEGRAKE